MTQETISCTLRLPRKVSNPDLNDLAPRWIDITQRGSSRTIHFGSPRRQEGKKMLILTRRVGETVMIGNDVTVTVLGVKGNQVRVGINAPKTIAVHREEIYERIKREQEGNSENDGESEPSAEFAST